MSNLDIKFKRLTPFKRCVLQNFPFIEADFDALTNYGLLCKIVEYLNQVIASQNEVQGVTEEIVTAFNNLYDYVHDYFNNLDVQEEINNKLDEMVEDGTLQEIIADYVDLNSRNFSNNYYTPHYLFTSYKACGTSTEMDRTIPHEQEGICYVGNNKVVTFYSPYGANITDSTETIIEEIDFSSKYNPTLVRTNTVTGLMHSNSACYDPITNKIYVALAQYAVDGNIVQTNKVATVDYNTLTVIEIRTITSLNSITKVSFYDNKLYAFADNAVYNITTDTPVKLFDVDPTKISGTQGLEIRNDKVYILMCYPFQIVKFSMDGVIEQIMSLDIFDDMGHAVEYYADFTFIDDDNIIVTPHIAGDYVEKSHYKYSYMINYNCLINLKGNYQKTILYSQLPQGNAQYIDTSEPIAGVKYSDGSQGHPHKLLQEYIRCKYHQSFNTRLISNVEDVTYYGTMLLDNETLGFSNDLHCEGLVAYNTNLSVYSLYVNSQPLEIRGSRICGSSMHLGYTGDTPHSISYSDILVPDIYNGLTGTSLTANIEARGSRLIRYQYTYKTYNENPLSAIESTISVSDTTLTANFSNWLTSTNFNPNAYILAIQISDTKETIPFVRWQGFGTARKFFDKDGNGYEVTTFNQSNQSLTITGTNVDKISKVTMFVL